MCDSDKKDSFTIDQALKVLDEDEDRLWSDLTKKDINNRK